VEKSLIIIPKKSVIWLSF